MVHFSALGQVIVAFSALASYLAVRNYSGAFFADEAFLFESNIAIKFEENMKDMWVKYGFSSILKYRLKWIEVTTQTPGKF